SPSAFSRWSTCRRRMVRRWRSRATRSGCRARHRRTALRRRRYPITDSALVPGLHHGLLGDLALGQAQHRRAQDIGPVRIAAALAEGRAGGVTGAVVDVVGHVAAADVAEPSGDLVAAAQDLWRARLV